MGPQGEVTMPNIAASRYGQSSDFVLRKHAATGELLAQRHYTVPKPEIDLQPGEEVYGGTWAVATEDAPDQDLYVMNAYGDSSSMLNPMAPMNTEVRLMNAALEPRTTNVDGPYHPALFLTPATEMRAGQQGTVVSTPHKWNFYGSFTAPIGTRVYELSHHAWDNVEVDHTTTLLPPRQYADNYTGSEMDTAPDGSIYVATFTSYEQDCVEVCPSVAGVTKLRGGQVEWQVFWDTDQAVGLRDLAAHENGVGLLVTSKRVTHSAEGTPTEPEKSFLLTFGADGTPLQNAELPLAELRSENPDLLPFEHLQLRSDGRFVASTGNMVAAGHLSSGVTRTQRLSQSLHEVWVDGLVSRGEYLYVQGGSVPGGLEQVKPTVTLPALGNDRHTYIQFALPYDFGLNPRW
ncbi:hypothetical protein GCM10017783_01080 [Deinococcus piscis]|uniref:Uncharacterized protein n=1 Tax=Deinococcus piscis TaxID=394230 RepID=A0ABQ3K1C0_9DEIO|nr:hypothetical protein GCM10017783_01080 [Deinococcus piscis]